MYGSFNANEFQPRMGGGGSHPVGIFHVTISNAEIVPTKNNDGGMYVVTFKSDKGEIPLRYNLWNSNETAVRIGRENLSALCHAIQFFNLNFDANGGRDIINAPLMIEVGPQMVPSDPEKPSSLKIESPNLREVKRVFSKEGRNPSSPNSPPVVPTEGDGGSGAVSGAQGGPPALPAFPSNAAPPAAATAAPAPAAGPSWAQPAPAGQAAPTPATTAKPPWA